MDLTNLIDRKADESGRSYPFTELSNTVTHLAATGNSGVALRKFCPFEISSEGLFSKYGETEEKPLGFDKQTGYGQGPNVPQPQQSMQRNAGYNIFGPGPGCSSGSAEDGVGVSGPGENSGEEEEEEDTTVDDINTKLRDLLRGWEPDRCGICGGAHKHSHCIHCGICGGAHEHHRCSLQHRCPIDQKVGEDFEVICLCGQVVVNGKCPRGCPFLVGTPKCKKSSSFQTPPRLSDFFPNQYNL